jgi:hypothetical protein
MSAKHGANERLAIRPIERVDQFLPRGNIPVGKRVDLLARGSVFFFGSDLSFRLHLESRRFGALLITPRTTATSAAPAPPFRFLALPTRFSTPLMSFGLVSR